MPRDFLPLARALTPSLLILALGPAGCGSDDPATSADGTGSSSSGTTAVGSSSDSGPPGTTSGTTSGADGSSGPGSSSGSSSSSSGPGTGTSTGEMLCRVEAQHLVGPANIVFVIDNSGSMTQEIAAIQTTLYPDFAAHLELAGVDYRIVMLSQHGALAQQSVCIEEPLSGIPPAGCDMPPPEPVNNPPIYQQYAFEISSHGAACAMLQRFDVADPLGLAPMGYGAWLDPEAFTDYVVITDDGTNCSAGTNYNDNDTILGGEAIAPLLDDAILALTPSFGTAPERRYRVDGLIGVAAKVPATPYEPWLPDDPLTTALCPSAVDPGTGYQALARLTGGLIYPLCDTAGYPDILGGLAELVTDEATATCDFALPDEVVDTSGVTLDYTPAGFERAQSLDQVADADACMLNDFYIDDAGIHLCPQVCALVEADSEPLVEVVFGC